MSDVKAQFSMLNQTADPAVADAIRLAVENGQDHELNRINVLDFAKRTGLDEERVISGFLHASRLGLFDLTWNVLCPGCGGVLGAHSTLKSLQSGRLPLRSLRLRLRGLGRRAGRGGLYRQPTGQAHRRA